MLLRYGIIRNALSVKAMGSDTDLDGMSREQLIQEVVKLRAGIRAHRDSSGHDLCWYHPELWNLLPEKTESTPSVPCWPQFLQGCVKFRQSLDLQAPDAPRVDEGYLKDFERRLSQATDVFGRTLFSHSEIDGILAVFSIKRT